jgi:hypothetical protein
VNGRFEVFADFPDKGIRYRIKRWFHAILICPTCIDLYLSFYNFKFLRIKKSIQQKTKDKLKSSWGRKMSLVTNQGSADAWAWVSHFWIWKMIKNWSYIESSNICILFLLWMAVFYSMHLNIFFSEIHNFKCNC